MRALPPDLLGLMQLQGCSRLFRLLGWSRNTKILVEVEDIFNQSDRNNIAHNVDEIVKVHQHYEAINIPETNENRQYSHLYRGPRAPINHHPQVPG